jgi:hypothetical protein
MCGGWRRRTSASQKSHFGATASLMSACHTPTLPSPPNRNRNVKKATSAAEKFKKTPSKAHPYSTGEKYGKTLVEVWVNFDKKKVLIISGDFSANFGRFLWVENRKLDF